MTLITDTKAQVDFDLYFTKYFNTQLFNAALAGGDDQKHWLYLIMRDAFIAGIRSRLDLSYRHNSADTPRELE